VPWYGEFSGLQAQRSLLLPGRKVVVNISTGNDTTGDGSLAAPYLTIGRGVLDLRNGFNDTLFITGNQNAITTEGPVVVANKSNITVVQAGLLSIISPTGRRELSPVTSWAIAGSNARATIASGHGFIAGDYVFVHNADTTGTARMRGLARVAASAATTVDLSLLSLVAGQQPLTGGAQGTITPCALAFEDCANVNVLGLQVSADLLSDTFSGLGFASTNMQIGRNITVAGCLFSNAALGFAGLPSGFSLLSQGSKIRVEGNVFALVTSGAVFTPTVRSFGMVHTTDTVDISFLDNTFQRSDFFGDPWMPDGMIHIGNDARFATVFTANRFDGSIKAGEGIPLNKIVRVQPSRTPARVFFEGNFYTHPQVAAASENFAVDSDGLVRERSALRFPGQENVSTSLDFVRRGAAALATLRVLGGTALAVQTNATQPDGFFDGTRVVVYNAAGAAFGLTHTYAQASGLFTLEKALPFTPAAGDTFLVLGTADVHSLLDHGIAPHTLPGSVGEALNNADVPTSSRAVPGDAMDLVTDAVDANAVATSGAQEIAAEVETDLSATHGAGSWATATGFATPTDVDDTETALFLAIGALTDLSIADVQTAMTNQGYTSVRAALLDMLDGNVTRGFDKNAESTAFFANADVTGSRFVPQGAVSHLQIRIKADGAADWTAPVDSYFVVFTYLPGATAADRAAAANTAASAPVDGTFTSTSPP